MSRELLRHAVATVAYRGGKAVREAPASFADFRVAEKSRTPSQILAHIGDLYDWALTQAKGAEAWNDSKPLPWDQEIARFHETLARFDAYLASAEPLQVPPERIFQGAVADSLTHIGQIAMLRRIAGAPIRGENYSRADIQPGRVGAGQAAPRREFD